MININPNIDLEKLKKNLKICRDTKNLWLILFLKNSFFIRSAFYLSYLNIPKGVTIINICAAAIDILNYKLCETEQLHLETEIYKIENQDKDKNRDKTLTKK